VIINTKIVASAIVYNRKSYSRILRRANSVGEMYPIRLAYVKSSIPLVDTNACHHQLETVGVYGKSVFDVATRIEKATGEHQSRQQADASTDGPCTESK